MGLAISADDVQQACARLRGHAVVTPLLESPQLNERVGRRVLLKFEGNQLTGSFKFRGAFNRLSQLASGAKVVAFSSGNHAQGVAAAAHQLGIQATIVMPSDAPRIKVDRTRSYGAHVVLYDRLRESREDIARQLVAEQQAVLVPSFDDPDIMAGQGSIGAEVVAQAAQAGLRVHTLLCPISGGGLLSGIATAIKSQLPDTHLYAVEPEGYDDTARSLRLGERVTNPTRTTTGLCDALLAPSPGKLTFPILHALVDGGLVVTEQQVREAVRYAFHTLKLVVEPGGAVALAALLAGLVPPPEHDQADPTGATVLILSGSNVDPLLFSQIVQEESA